MRALEIKGVATTALTLVFAFAARAETADDFYRAHPKIAIGVPAGAGGTYDLYTRLLARHLPKYLPGAPAVIVQNVPAAGGIVLTNQLYGSAPKDGTFLAMVRGSTIQEAVNGNPAAMFDGRKLAWLGNMNSEYEACVVLRDAPIQKISDLRDHEIIVGATGPGAQSYSFPLVYNAVLGMKFKVISGYLTSPDRLLAQERGELTGNCGYDTSTVLATLYEPYKSGKIRLLFQAAKKKDPRFPDVPNIRDEAKTPAALAALDYMFATLELGRPFAAPPETPPDRVALLRAAFERVVADPALIDEAKRLQLDLNTMTGAESAASVDGLYATPRAVVERVRAAVGGNP